MGNNSLGKIYYGWVIVLTATLALTVSNGLAINGIPAFYKSVQADLVQSGALDAASAQSLYGTAAAITFLLAGFLAPAAGWILDWLGARRMMIIGCVILGSGLIVYSQAPSPAVVYGAHAMMGASLGFIGVLVCTVLVSNWFTARRGLALGIALTGTSLGGVIIWPLATGLIAAFGWRTAMASVSLIVWLVLLPAVLFLVRNRPEEVSLLPEHAASGVNAGDQTPRSNEGMTLGRALTTPTFWIFALCAALVFYALLVVSQQFGLYLQSPKIGFSPAQASSVQSTIFALTIAGKFLFGYLSDRFSAARIMLLSSAAMFLSTLVFLHLTEQTVYIFAVIFGLSYGGTFVLLQLVLVDYFGLREFGKILGAATVIETLGGAIGTYATGKIADAFGGDYTQAFYGVIVVTGAAAALAMVLNLIHKPKTAAFISRRAES
jgi:MFS family permease